MKLQLKNQYKSVKQLKGQTDLPDFSILTGVNGSGKTHILEAIQSGDIEVTDKGQVIPTDEILFVKFNELSVSGSSTYSSQQAQQICNKVWDHFSAWKKNFNQDPGFRQNQESKSEAFCRYIERYRNPNDKNIEKIIEAIIHTLKSEPETELENIRKQQFWKNIFDPETSSADINFFEHNFAQLFAEYNISLMKQRFYKFLKEGNYPEAPNVDDETLRNLEENRPWDFVNQVLKAANFDFEVMPPDFSEADEFTYEIHLEKKSTHDSVAFNELSTGEKVLFALALVRYKAEKRTQKFPKLILLDEPDAPLHPAMNKGLIDVIQSVFVSQYGTKVIMTTHAPASIAFAPEDKVHVVSNIYKPEQNTQIIHSTRQEALQTLSSGFVAITKEENQAKLNIDIASSSKPVLFVEGVTDKLIIEEAWRKTMTGRIPFKIIDCGNDQEIKQKINAVSIAELDDRNVVALFDFDNAFNSFNGLSKSRGSRQVFGNIKGKVEEGHYRRRNNNGKKITAMLLPVPDYRSSYASIDFGATSMLSLELLFKDEVLSQHNNLGELERAGGSTIKTFQGDKMRFASSTVPSLDKKDFSALKEMLMSIKKHLSI